MATEYQAIEMEIALLGMIAQRRRDRGLKLSAAEAEALIKSVMLEAARDSFSYDAVKEAGRAALNADNVEDGVPHLVDKVSVYAQFRTGRALVTVENPI